MKRHLDEELRENSHIRIPDRVLNYAFGYIRRLLKCGSQNGLHAVAEELSLHINVCATKTKPAVLPFVATVLDNLRFLHVDEVPESFRICLAYLITLVKDDIREPDAPKKTRGKKAKRTARYAKCKVYCPA